MITITIYSLLELWVNGNPFEHLCPARYLQKGVMGQDQWAMIVIVRYILDVLLSALYIGVTFLSTITKIFRIIYQCVSPIFAQGFNIITHSTLFLLPILGIAVLVGLLIWFIRWVIYDGLA